MLRFWSFICGLIFLSFVLPIVPQIIKQEIKFIKGKYVLSFLIGEPPREVNSVIDINNELILFDNEMFNDTESSTVQFRTHETLDIGGEQVAVRNYIDNFSFPYPNPIDLQEEFSRITINNFHFGIIQNNTFHNKIGLGLGLYNTKSLSFIRQWYNNHLISKLSFALRYSSSESEIYFGGLPKEIASRYGYSSTCTTSKYKWGCSIYSVIIHTDELESDDNQSKRSKNNWIYYNDADVTFSTNEYKIFAPLDFIQWLNDNYLFKYADHNSCNYRNWLPEKIELKCDYMEFRDFPPITLLFNRFYAKFPLIELFYRHNRTDHWNSFVMNVNQNDKNSWNIGIVLLRKFWIEFDYDDKEINVFADTDIGDVMGFKRE